MVAKKPNKQEIVIPLDKIAGQRFGQLLYNAISDESNAKGNEEVGDRLFYIETDTLVECLQDYLVTLNEE